MKEGELMKEKNELDVLENAEQSVIERLTAEYPPRDEKEKEKIFSMSERKFKNRSGNITRNEEQTVSGVEVYKRPMWQRFLSIAAAFAIVVGGAAGGTFAFRKFRNGQSAVTEQDKKVAPFGDFAKLDYQLCDYSKEPIVKIVELDKGTEHDGDDSDLNVYIEDQITLPGGIPISQDKREKLADFFNNYDYKCVEHTIFNPETKAIEEGTDKASDAPEFKDYSDQWAKAILENPDPSKIEFEKPEIEGMSVGENVEPQAPYFICDNSNEIRMISIYKYDGIGCLAYFKMEYEEKDGCFVLEDYSSVEMKGWEIDYDYFKSTITAILNDEAYTLRDTSKQSAVNEKTAPFGNFSEKEYCISKTDNPEFFIDGTGYSLGLEHGKEIPLEKRKELEEFFNSQEWKKSDKEAYCDNKPFWLQTMDYLYFVYITDDEFNLIWLDRDEGTLSYDTCRVVKNPDDDTNYKCLESHLKSDIKVYDIDYDLFAAKIREILGDEFSDKTYEYNNFAVFNWTVDDTGRVLTEDERKSVYDVISKCEWTTEQPELHSQERNESDSIVLYHEKGSEHALLSLKTYDGITHLGYVEYTYKESGEYTSDDSNVMESYYCDDANIVKRISECISGGNQKEIPIDFSFLNEGGWGYRINEDHTVPYNGIDLYDKFEDQYGETTEGFLQLILFTNNISAEKRQRIASILDGKKWEILYESFSIPEDYNAYVDLTGQTSDHFVEMHIVSNDKTNICFSCYGYKDIDKSSIKDTESILYDADYILDNNVQDYDFILKSYNFSCSDPNVAQEIINILSE
jgi:hypothetical protein